MPEQKKSSPCDPKPKTERSSHPTDPDEVEEQIDESGEESFPASDPPAHKSPSTPKKK